MPIARRLALALVLGLLAAPVAAVTIAVNDDSTWARSDGGSGTTMVPTGPAIWNSRFTAAIPAGATNISFTLDTFLPDDKGVVTLNGVTIADAGTQRPNGTAAGAGTFDFGLGAGNQPYDFVGFAPGTVFPIPNGTTSVVLIGYINDTGSTDMSAPPLSAANISNFIISGTLAYDASPTTVTNTSDDGNVGSLRYAINYVNANCASQQIAFNIPGSGVQIIRVASALPVLTCASMGIDGYSQPGASRNTLAVGSNAVILIQIDGTALEASPANGLEFNTSNAGVVGLSITNFHGAAIQTDAPFGTGGIGVGGNFLGIDPSGACVGNEVGIRTIPGGTGLGIGNSTPGERNVISCNSVAGIHLQSGDHTNILGNYIGTDPSGTAARGNGIGVQIEGTLNTLVSDNVISGNTTHGMWIGPGQPGVAIHRNLIGADGGGTNDVGNGMSGISAFADGIVIGGTGPSDGNVVAFNHQFGISVAGSRNFISANSIHNNTNLGIDLSYGGGGVVAANDNCDPDSGANGLQNFPVLSSASPIGDGIRVLGSLNSTANTNFRIEFFSSPQTDFANNTAGRTFLGWTPVTTDGSCNAPIDASLFVPVAVGDRITATATDASNNTGWFSNNVIVAAAPAPAPTITAIRPASGSTAGGSAIVIEGTNLDTLTSVTFGGAAATVNNVGSSMLTVTTPGHASGVVDVVVTTPGGSATATNGFAYANDDNNARDFSIAVNPSPRWTYGWEPAVGGAFTPYGLRNNDGALDGWSSGSLPSVWHNPTAADVQRAGTNNTPPGAFGMHPGPAGETSVARWTAPAAGTYGITGQFIGLDFGVPTSTNVYILKNNNAASPLFIGGVFEYNVPHPFSTSAVVNAGDTIEFIVDYAGSYTGDATGLDATITLTGPPGPVLSFSTTSLGFAAQLLGTASASQPVTLTNIGTSAVTFSSVTIGPDFTKSTNCTTTLAPGASCTIDVTFAPLTRGLKNEPLDITSDAAGSPHSIALSGAAVQAPSVQITAGSTVLVGAALGVSVFVTNPSGNGAVLSGASVTLPYPPGFVNDTFGALGTSCSAGVSTDGVSMSATSGVLLKGVGCTLVTKQLKAPTTPGTYTFTIPAGGFTISSPFAWSNPTPITKTITVTATPPPPHATFNPVSLAFGSQNVGTTSAAQTVVLTNDGGLALSISSMAVTGPFAKSSTTCGTTVAAGASCNINVTFTPTATGTASGALQVVSNSGGSAFTDRIPLSGTGAAPAPAVTLTPSTLTFGARTIGTTSSAQTVTLQNSGTASLSIASITVSGDFAFTSACPSSLPQGATCTIDVTFTPVAEGARPGAVTITSNANGSPHFVSLSGTGQSAAVGVLEVTPTTLTFDPQALDTTSAPQLLTLHNTGTATVNRGPASFDGDFQLLTGADADAATHNQTCGASLTPDATCSLALAFKPTALGTRSGSIALPNDTPTPVITVHLFGTGANATPPRALTVQPQLLAFGDQAVGTRSNGKTVTLTNTLTSAAVITDLVTSPSDFIVSDTCTTIGSHATCSPLVTFQPTAVGPRAGTLTIRTFAESAPYTVQLSGTGIFNGVPALGVSLTRIGFGNVLLGGSNTLGFTLTNIGLVPVILGAVNMQSDFAISSNSCGATLEVGATCSIGIVFFPHAVGVRATTVDIFSNAANSPHHVELSGTGCALPTPTRARVRPVLCGP